MCSLLVVLQVGENVIHESRDQWNRFLLLVTAVHHVQKWCQDLWSKKVCQVILLHKGLLAHSLTISTTTKPYLC